MTARLQQGWKGPSLKTIATLAGLGTATVDRVLNNRAGVSEKTRARVLSALEKLSQEAGSGTTVLDLRLFCDSGASFNAAMETAVAAVNRSLPGVHIRGSYTPTSLVDPATFARRIEEEGAAAGGVMVAAREHPAVNRAIRRLCAAGIPVICLTTDLPSSRRSAYIGNDQYAAGSTAALLIGNALPRARSSILIVTSAAFRSQQEREMGFRRVLRSDFPHLRVEERVVGNEDLEATRAQMQRFFGTRGVPVAIYNLAGANRAIAGALTATGHARDTIFVGHELTIHTRALLESGVMDYVISHDFGAELTQAAQWIQDARRGVTPQPAASQILVHTRYNCGL